MSDDNIGAARAKNGTLDMILQWQDDARQRGVLLIWTVYDHPLDHPNGFIARAFEIGGGSREPVPTEHRVSTLDYVADNRIDLAHLRDSLSLAGLHCMPRGDNDAATVIESWI